MGRSPKACGLGIHSGDRISRISTMSIAPRAYWARLAGVRIISAIPFGEEYAFWKADAPAQRRILQVLAGWGAKIVITAELPPGANRQGWLPIGKTSFYGHPLLPREPGEGESPGSR